ncbi:MAG: adenosylcobalamin-dependent ribonucleoside-diphosphate reductase [Porticoccaceae bacterium]|nr:adenosylcobalamin-dependent ribonucleoside-diphosphate reductase [Porticoccaceae bacterium]
MTTDLHLNPNTVTILEKRYLNRDDTGKIIETPAQMFKRVADAVAAAESTPDEQVYWAGKFYELLISRRFLPNSPTLMNAGLGRGTLSACFVLPVEDNLVDENGIMEAALYGAAVQKFGGGTGYSLSRLRSTHSGVNSTHGRACGPVSVLKHLDDTSRLVTQGGKREGANMAVLRYDHPDILEFIGCKAVDGDISRFNISVGVDDHFFHLLDTDGDIELREPHDGTLRGTIPASELFNQIVTMAHSSGDPGLIFLDTINNSESNPVPRLGPIETTNPCGEVPQYPFDACNLGSLDILKYTTDKYGPYWTIDYSLLALDIATAVRFLDNVVTVNDYPLPQIREVNMGLRRIGLGVMGVANSLFRRGIPYNTQLAVEDSRALAEYIKDAADNESHKLAVERGAFPLWDESIYANPPAWLPEKLHGRRLRNANRTVIAPTGTIAQIAETSSGIEPEFALAYVRRMTDSKEGGEKIDLIQVNPVFRAVLAEHGYEIDSPDTIDQINAGAPLHELFPNAPLDALEAFVTAQDISLEWHLKHQAAWQENICNGVSKTINLPSDATEDDVRQSYLLANELRCKGITIYRDGSKSMQVLEVRKTNTGETADDGEAIPVSTPFIALPLNASEAERTVNVAIDLRGFTASIRRELPKDRTSHTHEFSIGGTKCYMTYALFEDGSPGEVFLMVAKNGSTLRSLVDAFAILTSLHFQYGTPLEELAKHFVGMRFEPSGMTDDRELPFASSILDYVFRYLLLKIKNTVTVVSGEPEDDRFSAAVATVAEHRTPAIRTGDLCPDCGDILVMMEGCSKCPAPGCGYSRC